MTHAGAPVAPDDASTYEMVQSVLGHIERAIAPLAARIGDLGGHVVADVTVGLEVNIKVHNLPPDVADDVLERCRREMAGE